MKLSIQAKIALSYVLIILVTLLLFGVMMNYSVASHFQDFYLELGDFELEFYDGRGGRMRDSGDRFLQSVQEFQIYVFLGASSVAIILSLLISEYVTAPIQKIIKATKNIAKGKYSERVEVETDDEIGELSHALNIMAEQLEDNRRLQKSLISNVAHELATPLMNIGGYTEALKDDVIKGKKLKRQTLEIIKEETERLAKMVDEVRALVVIEQPQFKLEKKKRNVETLIKKAIQKIKPQFKEKSIAVNLNVDEKMPKVSLDQNRFTQILINLLANAEKFSSQDGKIEINVTHEKNQMKLAIKDNGIGIPSHELPYIFERFYRTDKSRSRETGGIGLGLTIVKELVEAHDGEIKVASKKGKGTTFTCYFPV